MAALPRLPLRPALAGAALAAVLAPAALAGQTRDFLFERPRATLGFNLGWASPRADSEIFDFTRNEFTVGDGAFDAMAFSAEFAWRATERVDLGVELGWSEGEAQSEYREFVGVDDLPIVQTTRLQRRPITFHAKYYLTDRGRSISRFAWVPEQWSPWVGAGAGWMWYRFEQEGEFVDYQTLDIFRDLVASEGTTGTLHVMGGADLAVTPRFLLSGQLRYGWASARLDPFAYEGFDEIDLAGFQATAGIKVQF